jgi:hypothetical protein
MPDNQAYQTVGLKYSGGVHIALLLLMIFGLPSWFSRDIPQPTVMSVEILPISEISNVKPSEKMPEEKKDKPKEEQATAKKETQESSTPKEEPKPDSVPLPKDEKIKEKEKPKEKPKDEKPKKKEEDLDSILKSVQDMAKKEKSEKPTEKEVTPTNDTKSKSQNYDPTIPLSMSEKDAIRSQFIRCWNVPAGAKDAQNLVVVLRIALEKDGSVIEVKLARDQGRYGGDSFFRAAADSAIRAVKMCSPLKNLSADKYGAWSDMELTFDPKEMLN